MQEGQHQCEHTFAESALWTLDSSLCPVCISQQNLPEMSWRTPAVYPSEKLTEPEEEHAAVSFQAGSLVRIQGKFWRIFL